MALERRLRGASRQARALPTGTKVLLALALILHLSMLFSWRYGLWNRFTFDSVATHGRRGWDFYALYQAGHNVLTDISVYESANERIDVVVPLYTPYRYLPLPALTLGVLLNVVSPLWAFRFWVLTIEFVLLGCAALSYRLAREPAQGVTLAAMWLCFTPYYLEIYLGQFTLVQAAFVLVMLSAELRSWPRWRSGLAWIASLLWKQNTGLFLPIWLRLRRWRLLGLAGAVVLAVSAPYFWLYPGSLGAFLGNFGSGPLSHQLGNLGVRQALYSVSSALLPAMPPWGHQAIQIAWVGAALVVCLWLTFREALPDVPLLLCLWTCAYFMLYHHVWEHHYVLLLPVFVTLYLRTRAPLVLILYLLIAVWTPYVLIDPQGMAAYHGPMRWTPLEPRTLDVAYHASKALPTVVLWCYVARLVHLTRDEGDPA